MNKYIVVFIFWIIIFPDVIAQEKSTFKPEQYNLLFIMVDDLRPELGCYGKKHMITPNIDRLAKRGLLFENAYVNIPVCGASRASIISGLYPSRDRYTRWNCFQDEDAPGIISLPMHFKNNGYKTTSLSKVYNSISDGRGSWDEVWYPSISTTKWDYQSPEAIQDFEKRNTDRSNDLSTRNVLNLPKKGVSYEAGDVSDITYMDGRTASYAISKLQEFKNSGERFFLAAGFKKPHLPFNAPKKYWDLYSESDIIIPSNEMQINNFPETGLQGARELWAQSDIPKVESSDFSDALVKKLIHGYYASVSYIDAQVGLVLDELEYLGLSENTIVVFWSDHGYFLGENGFWCKQSNYKLSLNIPLIIYVPELKGDVKVKGLVESVDIFPTLCELVGISKPFHLQGESFLELLKNPELNGKNEIFCRSARTNGETIITQTHSYTEFFNKEGDIIGRMLFNTKLDPLENNNIVLNPNNKLLVERLSEKLNKHMINRNLITLNK